MSSIRLLVTRFLALMLASAAAAGVLAAQARTQATKDLPLEPTRTIHIDTEEGSWISLDVSPDGSTLVFDLLGDLYTMPFAGGTATQLTRGLPFDAQPRFSPDGKAITYTSDKDGGENIWIMDLATKTARAITKGKDNRYQSPEWTPDGNYVVASRTGIRGPVVQLWMFHKDGGNGIQLIKEPANRMTTGAAFGADGRYLWFAQRTGNWQYNAVFPQYQLAVYDRETGQVSVRSSRNGSGIRPTLSPDGKWLVYGTRFENQTGLRIRDLASGDERWLAFPVQRDDQEARSSRDALPGMSFTPDSREVVASYGGKIWRIPADGAAPIQIPFRVTTDIDLGPKLAFNYPVSDEPEFTVKQIRDAVPSPDGTKLAFAALDRLYLVDLPGGTPRRLTTMNQTEAEPAWSPDGQWLAFVTWSDSAGGRVLKVRVGAPDRRAGRGAANQGPVVVSTEAAIYRSPVFSPDGGRIVAVRGPAEAYREGVGPQAPGSATDLVWFPAAGGAARLIAPTGNRGSPHFTQDTGRIFLSGNDGLVSIRFDGTDEKKHVKVTAPPLLSQERPAPADLILMAPRGDQALVQTGFDFYVVTVPQIGAEPATVALANPANAAVPVRRLSEVGGEFPAWSADGRKVHWSLGNGHFVYDLDRARAFDDSVKRIPRDSTARSDSTKAPTYQPAETRIVVKATRDTPSGTLVLRGGRIVTMQGDRIIERGDVVVTNNRIVAVGETGQVTAPAG
ncbi:MAG: amidohydrolase, partial [Gemmatimonadales bacterium]